MCEIMRIGISILKNTIQEYAWGSHTAIPKLLGKCEYSESPQAELWMGAHPKSPSSVLIDGRWVSLVKLITDNPEDILGKNVAKKFNNRLPYLFKVLAAEKPLSIQAHPDLSRAREGFERESRLSIPLDAPGRNYKDDNHKPEIICALTPFWALNGFRKINHMVYLMEKACGQGMKEELNDLKNSKDSNRLKKFFISIMNLNPDRQKNVIDEILLNAQKYSCEDSIFQWVIKLHEEYPGDIGIFFPVLLNLIRLEPGEAMFISSGVLHAYLKGIGIELMANSDNVLRGGLTPKHIDLHELLNVLQFTEKDIVVMKPDHGQSNEKFYLSHTDEFVLSVIFLDKDDKYKSPEQRSAEIIFCTRGEAEIIEYGDKSMHRLSSGVSVFVPASVKNYTILGDATFYKAAVPG